MAQHSIIMALVALVATGCDRGSAPDATKEDAVKIADEKVRIEFPEADLKLLRKSVRDNGDTWIIEYRVPDGFAGGGPTIEIDKSSRKVISAWASQ